MILVPFKTFSIITAIVTEKVLQFISKNFKISKHQLKDFITLMLSNFNESIYRE